MSNRIDLRSIDDLIAYERQAQREDRERLGGLRAAFFLVAACIGGTMLFGAVCAWIFSVKG